MLHPWFVRYFLTFACYGAHMHGEEMGIVDRDHNTVGGRYVPPDPRRAAAGRALMHQSRYILAPASRPLVLEAICNLCAFRGWNLIGAHVRSTHVHVILETGVSPEKALNDIKAHISRSLNESGLEPIGRRRWARHGSTRWLWRDAEVRRALQYIIDEQGAPMCFYVAPDYAPSPFFSEPRP